MRFLVDQSVSPWVAEQLRVDGHDAIHVQAVGLRDASDEVILEYAKRDDRIIISVDTDFGKIVATLMTPGPSVVLFRKDSSQSPVRQIALLRANLPPIEPALASGALVTITGYSVRVRQLPIGGTD